MGKNCKICGEDTLDNSYDHCINCYNGIKGNKEEYIDKKIKGTIAETIVEEMFRKLGFFVLKLGKEMTINPITQIEEFIKKTSGTFKLEKDNHLSVSPVSYINKLPDFVIINTNGRVELLEVKFRRNGLLLDNDEELFDLYPHALMLIVNLDVSDELFKSMNYMDDGTDKILKETRFHIWSRTEDRHGKPLSNVESIKEFLKKEFKLEDDKLINKYEEIVKKWIR